MLGSSEHVLVAPPAHIHYQDVVGRELRRLLRHVSQRMRRLERRDDAFGSGAQLERVQRLLIRYRDVFDAADIPQKGMLRTDPGIVETRRDGMAFEDLTVRILQQICAVAVEHAGTAAVHGCRVAVLDLETMAALHDADPVTVHRINLGGIHHKAGRRERLPYLYLTDEEMARLEALESEATALRAETAALRVEAALREGEPVA